MAPVALRAAYPGSELSDTGLNPIFVPQGMIPTLDEQPEENEDLEDGIVLAQQCPSFTYRHAHLDFLPMSCGKWQNASRCF